MKILDLHGAKHHGVETQVTNFVLMNEVPLKIITGDSDTMRKIVFGILDEHGFEYHPEFYTNYGAFIIRDKTN
jgi:hypothetical protein